MLFLTAIFLFLAATNIQGGWLYFVDAILWSVVCVGALLPILQMRGIRLSRHLRSEARVQQPVSLETRLQIKGKLPLSFMNLTEYTPVAMRAKTKSPLEPLQKSFIELLKVNETHSLHASFTPEHPGIHTLQKAQTGSFGPLGLMGLYRNHSEPFSFVVSPNPPDTTLNTLSKDQQLALKNAHQRSFQPEDVSHFRNYQAGDNRRLIHWRNSARRQSLVVGEARQEPLQRAALWVNLHKSQSRETALSIMQQAIDVAHMLTSQDLIVDCFAPEGTAEFWEALNLTVPGRELYDTRNWDALAPWLGHLEQDATRGFDSFAFDKSTAALQVVVTDQLASHTWENVAQMNVSVLCFTREADTWKVHTL